MGLSRQGNLARRLLSRQTRPVRRSARLRRLARKFAWELRLALACEAERRSTQRRFRSACLSALSARQTRARSRDSVHDAMRRCGLSVRRASTSSAGADRAKSVAWILRSTLPRWWRRRKLRRTRFTIASSVARELSNRFSCFLLLADCPSLNISSDVRRINPVRFPACNRRQHQ